MLAVAEIAAEHTRAVLPAHLIAAIKWCGDASARCSGSSQLDLRSTSCVSTPLSITPSTFNATSSHGPRCGYSEPKRRRSGKMPSPRDGTRSELASSRPPKVAVTRPGRLPPGLPPDAQKPARINRDNYPPEKLKLWQNGHRAG
jgi:hypothetical protein